MGRQLWKPSEGQTAGGVRLETGCEEASAGTQLRDDKPQRSGAGQEEPAGDRCVRESHQNPLAG